MEYGTIVISSKLSKETRMRLSPPITGDLIISLSEFVKGKTFRRSTLERFGKRKSGFERSFVMKTETLFGGAIVELSVSSATEETPANPKIAPTTQAFLEAYRLAHDYGESEAFSRFFDAFLDETLIFLEDRYVGKNANWDMVDEMEDFMNQRYEKKDDE
jgi:hypothetical protein